MSEKIIPPLTGIPETLLITLHARAEESKRPDALLHDEKAVALADQMRSAATFFIVLA